MQKFFFRNCDTLLGCILIWVQYPKLFPGESTRSQRVPKSVEIQLWYATPYKRRENPLLNPKESFICDP